MEFDFSEIKEKNEEHQGKIWEHIAYPSWANKDL